MKRLFLVPILLIALSACGATSTASTLNSAQLTPTTVVETPVEEPAPTPLAVQSEAPVTPMMQELELTGEPFATAGDPNAPITVVEFSDYGCPFCRHYVANTYPAIKQDYIDTGKVLYVFRVFPLRSDDGSAEKIARCLPEDKYFAFIDLLFKNQPKWDWEYGLKPPQVREGLVLLGRIAGMSREQVDQCMVNKAEDERINQVAADGQSRYSITGTPTFILNGTSIGSGNIPFDTLSKLLDTELAKQK